MTYRIENETATIACLLRERLFEFNVAFGACAAQHPEDKHLNLVITGEGDAEEPDCILREMIVAICDDLNETLSVVDAYLLDDTSQNEEP